jgi:hypothetical protein
VANEAQGQLVQHIATGDFSGTTGLLTDAPVAIAAANLSEDGTGNLYHYVYTAGTAALSSTNTVFQVVRYSPFTFGSQITAQWPGSDAVSLGDTSYVLEGMAKLPLQTSYTYTKGTTRLYLLGHGPGSPGHTDLVVAAIDEDLKLRWTARIQHDDPYPAYIYATDVTNGNYDGVAVGTTINDASTGLNYQVTVLRGTDGVKLFGAQYSSSGSHTDVLKGVAVYGSSLYALGTSYSPADGTNKMVVAAWSWIGGGTTPTVLDVPGAGDGRNYDAVAMCLADRLGSAVFMSITGTVVPSTDHPTWHNYYTVAMEPAALPSLQILWHDEYDGLGGGDDVPAAVQASGDVVKEDLSGHSYTWVTGRSRGLTGNDDIVTICYDWHDPGTGTHQRDIVWKARWYNGASAQTNPGTDQGLALSWDERMGDTINIPYVYVLGQTQNLVNGNLDYVYLSYDMQSYTGTDEQKVTRWQPSGYLSALPADCFYHSSSGHSFPAALTVIRDLDQPTLTDYMFRTGTAPSLTPGNGYDFITTAELDNEP